MAVTLGGLSINNPLALPPANSGAPASAPATSGGNGVYWVGADNNVYTKVAGQNGVQNVGPNGIANPKLFSQYKQIANPVSTPAASPSQSAASAPVAPVQGSSAPTYADKSNDIAMQEAGLNAVGSSRDTGLSTIDKTLGSIMGRYDTEANAAKTEYGNESNANQTDLQRNKEVALANAVQGRQGLYGTLASLGALSGTGLELANRAVQKGANEDLTTGADTFATNQNALDSGYNAFTTQDAERREQAQRAAENNKSQVSNDYYKNEQVYLKNLGDDYQAEGKTGPASDYYKRAAALFPNIATSNVPAMDIGYSGSAYTAPTLSSYVGRANNTTVQSTPGGVKAGPFTVPGLLAVNKKQAA